MTNKNIWYLHHYAGAPDIGMSYRPYHLAKVFNKMGYNPSIIAASFHHLLTRELQQKQSIKKEIIDDIPFIWLKTNSYKGNSVGRLINMLTYAIRIKTQSNNILNLAGKPDTIIVSSTHPFHYFSAAQLAKKYNTKLIFEVRDLWPLSIIELLNVNPQHPLLKWMSYIEKKAYREADYVVSLLPNAFNYMEPLGLDKERFIYIPNGIAITDNQESTILPNALRKKIFELKSKKKFIVVYAGAHGNPNALHQLIDALRILKKRGRNNIHAILVGKGIQKKQLQNSANAKKLNNVSFFDPIPRSGVTTLLKEADAGFIGWQNKPLYHYGVSANKIFDYMLAGKPIIHAINTKNDPVALANCGIITPPEKPEKLAETMLELADLHLSELKAMEE